jgi:hypothetical protein
MISDPPAVFTAALSALRVPSKATELTKVAYDRFTAEESWKEADKLLVASTAWLSKSATSRSRANAHVG